MDKQNNIYSIWKPTMITSNDVLRKVKKTLSLDKVGHCGTLDPFAEGVLIVLSGDRTADSNVFMNQKKTYTATINFGSETDTLDCTGEVIRTRDSVKKYRKKDIVKTLSSFVGEIYQRPPCFSAKKINGVRLYKLARRDIFIHLKPVKVVIEKVKYLSYKDNKLSIEVSCYKGTYIRQLAKDIAISLGTYGHLSSLVRTSIGDYGYNNSITLEEL